jgi:hypothetical protein
MVAPILWGLIGSCRSRLRSGYRSRNKMSNFFRYGSRSYLRGILRSPPSTETFLAHHNPNCFPCRTDSKSSPHGAGRCLCSARRNPEKVNVRERH